MTNQSSKLMMCSPGDLFSDRGVIADMAAASRPMTRMALARFNQPPINVGAEPDKAGP
ncbi:MAG: hypothetical protein DHS20C05_23570 [Hyphococcus sp.]|nr:MAG: hypothetical protein DHS20C05_23570 [Marinicaulis sp.]